MTMFVELDMWGHQFEQDNYLFRDIESGRNECAGKCWKVCLHPWASVKVGDTLAVFVKTCSSCRTNSTTTYIMLWPVTALHTTLNGYALLRTIGVQIVVYGGSNVKKNCRF